MSVKTNVTVPAGRSRICHQRLRRLFDSELLSPQPRLLERGRRVAEDLAGVLIAQFVPREGPARLLCLDCSPRKARFSVAPLLRRDEREADERPDRVHAVAHLDAELEVAPRGSPRLLETAQLERQLGELSEHVGLPPAEPALVRKRDSALEQLDRELGIAAAPLDVGDEAQRL